MIKSMRSILLSLVLSALLVIAFAGNVLAVPSPTDSNKRAVIVSPLEDWIPTWHLESEVLNLELAGYEVDVMLNENASIGFFKTGLPDYDLIVLRTDSFKYEGTTYYCSGDPINSITRATYAMEIMTDEVKMGACVGFSGSFLHNYYYTANSTRPVLVYAVGSDAAELSWVFLDAGAAAFVSYYEQEYTLSWGRMDALTTKVLSYLSQGYSLREVGIELYVYLKRGHGETADWPTLYVVGDEDLRI